MVVDSAAGDAAVALAVQRSVRLSPRRTTDERGSNVKYGTDIDADDDDIPAYNNNECKVAVLTYKVLNGSAPRYLGPLVPFADLPGRRTLRSAGTNRLLVPPVRLSTVGNRAFPVAGPRVWNTLPEDITTSQSLSAFCQRLKTWLFGKSYPDIII